MRKLIGWFLQVVSAFLITVIACACLLVAVPHRMGYQVYNIISESMTPELPVGTAVYMKAVDPMTLQRGDIIAYESAMAGSGVITHRVVENHTDTEELITKGDANEVNDFAPVRYSQVIGRMGFAIPLLGAMATFIGSSSGKLVMLGIILLALLVNSIGKFLHGQEKKARQKKAKQDSNEDAEGEMKLEFDGNTTGKNKTEVDGNAADEKMTDPDGDATEENKKATASGRKSVLPLLVMLLALLLLAGGGYSGYRIFRDYHNSNVMYENLAVDATDHYAVLEWDEELDVDFKSLTASCPEAIAWIYFEKEDLSYPVCYSGDDEKYLVTGADGQKAKAGDIFLEAANSPDFSDSHTIVYGHNMRNLSMFGKLKYYHQKEDYYEEHAFFQIITPNGKFRYQIFAYEDVAEDSFVYQVWKEPNENFEAFIQQIYRKSQKDTEVIARSSDRIVTLSTCSTKGRRFVVHGVLVSEAPAGEVSK